MYIAQDGVFCQPALDKCACAAQNFLEDSLLSLIFSEICSFVHLYIACLFYEMIFFVGINIAFFI